MKEIKGFPKVVGVSKSLKGSNRYGARKLRKVKEYGFDIWKNTQTQTQTKKKSLNDGCGFKVKKHQN